ncbi:hypothetical protein QUF84_00650 [Fictibacillus enclensis]|uniref:hypothetical protein n=1 Tax=Fictibacillus enclensis TaxID=1017270 RepID=UPI0025A02ABF|nr:hypothetical protein [Fictibacillus enclensis]MDM5335806.1 hypothetical protein [Fictibacillus enclensis]
MFENPDLIKVSVELAKYGAQSSVQAIMDRIRAAKAKSDHEETINNLEEIINNLIAEKNELITIAQAYDQQLIAQKISEEDIRYITSNIFPLLENFVEHSDHEDLEITRRNLEAIKPLLLKETFNILQLLGFNFKEAIGQPLTELVNKLISSKINHDSDDYNNLQILIAQRDVEYFKLLQNEEAYERFLNSKG